MHELNWNFLPKVRADSTWSFSDTEQQGAVPYVAHPRSHPVPTCHMLNSVEFTFSVDPQKFTRTWSLRPPYDMPSHTPHHHTLHTITYSHNPHHCTHHTHALTWYAVLRWSKLPRPDTPWSPTVHPQQDTSRRTQQCCHDDDPSLSWPECVCVGVYVHACVHVCVCVQGRGRLTMTIGIRAILSMPNNSCTHPSVHKPFDC